MNIFTQSSAPSCKTMTPLPTGLLWYSFIFFVFAVSANIILVDSDTFLVNRLDVAYQQISNNFALFHDDEGCLDSNKTIGQKNLVNHFAQCNYHYQNKPFFFPANLHLYNAGLIGVKGAALPEVRAAIDLHDELYPQHKLYFTEQLCIIYQLQKKYEIKIVEPLVRHYWYIKEIDSLIDGYLRNVPPEKIENDFSSLLQIKSMVPSYKKFKSVHFKFPWKIKKKLIKIGWLKPEYLWS